MSKIQIPSHLLTNLGGEVDTDENLVDARLWDGRMFSNLVVRERLFFTGKQDELNGEGNLPFTDVANPI